MLSVDVKPHVSFLPSLSWLQGSYQSETCRHVKIKSLTHCPWYASLHVRKMGENFRWMKREDKWQRQNSRQQTKHATLQSGILQALKREPVKTLTTTYRTWISVSAVSIVSNAEEITYAPPVLHAGVSVDSHLGYLQGSQTRPWVPMCLKYLTHVAHKVLSLFFFSSAEKETTFKSFRWLLSDCTPTFRLANHCARRWG